MTIDQLDSYIGLLFQKHDELGAEFVRRQVEWAEAELRRQLAEKSSSIAETAHQGASPSAEVSAIVAK